MSQCKLTRVFDAWRISAQEQVYGASLAAKSGQQADVNISGEPRFAPVLDGHAADETEPAPVTVEEPLESNGLVD